MSPNSATDWTRPRVRSVTAVRALLDAAAGNLGVLRLQRARHVGDRQVVGAQPGGIERDVDLARPAADDDDLADAADALELAAQRLVGVLGDVADRLVGRDRERQHRRGVGIELLDRRLLDGLRQQRQHAVDAVAHFLRGDVGVLLEQERDDHLRDAFRRVRAQLVDAADGVDRFFDLVGDLGLDFLRRRAGSRVVTTTVGKSTFGKAVEAEPRNANAPTTVSERMMTVAKTGRVTEIEASHCMDLTTCVTEQ